jgi:CheY-like chemotaxis protein
MAAATKPRLLIVDDERDLVEPVARRLRGRYELSLAYDGREGLAAARRERPDVVLLDLAMPVMDGWELCSRLRREPETKNARLIIMTAWLSDDLEKRAKEAGAQAVLLKPFEEEALAAALAAPGGAP